MTPEARLRGTRLHPALALFALAIALLASAPLWGAGMVNTRGGGDSPFLLQRTLEMAENLRYGIFPARWMSHAAYDLGYPFFSYYAALPYYISGGLTAISVPPIVAIQATQTLGFILAGLGAALWARSLFSRWEAVALVVVAYTFAPFHLVNVYVRGDSLSEFYAFVWYPLILWSLRRAADRPSAGRWVAAALAYGALIVTHNVSAMIFTPFALAYALLVAWQPALLPTADTPGTRTRWRRITRQAIPFALGIVLTAWFWLPALAETGYVHLGEAFTEGYFHFSQHFRSANLIQLQPIFDYDVAIRVEEAGPFAMGLAQALACLAGVAAVILRGIRDKSRIAPGDLVLWVYLAGATCLATVMITPLSRPAWELIPLLELIQFPWRFLSVQALFTAALTGALLSQPAYSQGESGSATVRLVAWRRIAVAALSTGLLIAATLAGLRPERSMIDDQSVNWDTLRQYETFTGNIGTTIRYEYMPVDVEPRPYISEAVIDGQGSVTAESDAIQAELLKRTPERQIWQVEASDPTTLTFPLHWWPGWQAQVDGVPVTTSATEGSGRLCIAVTAGQHTVELRLRNPPLRSIAEGVSLTAACAMAVWLFIAWRRSGRTAAWKTLAAGACRALVVAAIAVALPLVLHRSAIGSASLFDFNRIPYPHAGPVYFDSAVLEEAIVTPGTAQAGDAVTVSLDWSIDTQTPVTVTLELVSPAQPRHSVAYTLAQLNAPLSASMALPLYLPDDLSRGLYLVALQLRGPDGELTPRTAEGHGMGCLHIGTVRIPDGNPAQDLQTLARFEDLILHDVTAEQPDATHLRLRMGWSTPGTARNWTLSLRLLDAEGEQLTHPDGSPIQLDVEPGYGYLPTSMWHSGELVVDHPVLPLPEGLAPGRYILRVISYLRATMASGGEIDVPIQLTEPTIFDLRNACCEQTRRGATIMCQAGGIALLGLEMPETVAEGQDLFFFAQWDTVGTPTDDLTVSWALVDPEGVVAGSAAGPVATGSSTRKWPRHTWVRTPVSIDLPPVISGGAYTLRLALRGDANARATCELEQQVTITPRPRLFTVPEISHGQNAVFGDGLQLLGYDLERDRRADNLTLTLWWKALMPSESDLKRFVHLYDPASDTILAQDDAMPRNWTYPTSWWAAGEIVSDTVVLDLSQVPAGIYSIGVGWYDPATLVRLPVSASQADRFTLMEDIKVR